MGETDVTFRHLLRGLPQPLLQLAFPGRGIVPLGPPLDPSVDRARQRTADSMFRVRDGRLEAAVHVEIEREWRPTLAARLFDYASAAVGATRLPVWTVLVLLRPGGRPPRDVGVYRIPGAGIGGDAFVYRYNVLPLWRFDARRMRADLGLVGAPFCVAMRGADEVLVRDLAEDVRADRGLAPRDRQTTMQLLYVVSAAILGTDAARRIFHMDSIIQDPNVQELIREWEDKGRAKGRAEGRAKGRAEGRLEGRLEGRAKGRAEEARKLLYKVLAARSFRITPTLRARIDDETDVAHLEAWLEAAVTARATADVFRAG